MDEIENRRKHLKDLHEVMKSKRLQAESEGVTDTSNEGEKTIDVETIASIIESTTLESVVTSSNNEGSSDVHIMPLM